MKTKTIVKTGIDIAMTIALLLLMAYQLIGEKAHEWIGMIMFFLFVIHHLLNRAWSRNLMSIHLGFHWNMMIAVAGKAIGRSPKGIGIAMRIIAILIAVYGVIAFVKRDFWNYMILKNHFAFYDFSEPVIFFLLDYLAVMGLFVFAGHYLGKNLQKTDFLNNEWSV